MNAMSRIPHHPEVTNVFEVLTSSAQQVDILAADTIIQVVVNVWKCIQQHAITVIAHSSFGVAIDTDWLVVIRTTE